LFSFSVRRSRRPCPRARFSFLHFSIPNIFFFFPSLLILRSPGGLLPSSSLSMVRGYLVVPSLLRIFLVNSFRKVRLWLPSPSRPGVSSVVVGVEHSFLLSHTFPSGSLVSFFPPCASQFSLDVSLSNDPVEPSNLLDSLSTFLFFLWLRVPWFLLEPCSIGPGANCRGPRFSFFVFAPRRGF